MNRKLPENIRTFRKARSLTQEQLAEALGVTAGAVYKWEAGLSTPDIDLIVALADLFDTSVDVLLGYQVRDNKVGATVARLKDYLHRKDRSGLAEAEKALLRYPNSFPVVHQSATLYYLFGLMTHEEAVLRRAIALMERSILLLEQNTDPEISALTIHIDIATAWAGLGDDEKMLEMLKKDNPRGINNDFIGFRLSGSDRLDEAVDYLSAALVDHLTTLVRIVFGYVNVYFKRKDFASAKSMLGLAIGFFVGFKKAGRSNLLDKSTVSLYVCLAFAELELGAPDAARQALRAARELALAFDRSPDYAADSLRYVSTSQRRIAFDDLGETAMDGLRGTVQIVESPALVAMWEEVDHEE